jgi:hypothetical protein
MMMEDALKLSIKAFKLRKTKLDTLALCFEQIKPILERYMEKNQIPYIKVDLKTRKALVVEPIPNAFRQFWVDRWLDGECSTEQLKEWLNYRFQNTHYLNFADFLEDVKSWLKGN